MRHSFESVYSTLVLVCYRDQRIKRRVQKELRMKTWLPGLVRRGPETPTMAGNDRATNGKSDSHTVILGCVERVEKSVHNLRIETNARILHAQAHVSAFVWFSPDQQLP